MPQCHPRLLPAAAALPTTNRQRSIPLKLPSAIASTAAISNSTIATIDRSGTSIASAASPLAWQTVDCDRLLASRDAVQVLICVQPVGFGLFRFCCDAGERAKCLLRPPLRAIVRRRQGQTWRRATKFPNPLFDKALAECKADKSWNTIETNFYHVVMLDEPQCLAETLTTAA